MFKIKKGKSSYYVDENKKRVKNKTDLKRIENMRIPPAWNKVVVSKDPESKVQAIGIDEKGRSQFIYSQEHKDKSKNEKYKRVNDLGKKMSKITRAIRSDLKEPGFEKKKAAALIVMLIILTSLRIGSELNKKLYNSYGMTTLLKKHLKFHPDKVTMKFIGKKGVENNAVVKDKFVCGLLKQWLNKFKPKANDRLPLNPDEQLIKKTHIKKNMVEAMKRVSNYLNNTPAVCKKEYCSPDIVNYYMEDPMGLKRKIANIRSEKNCGNGDKYERATTYFLQ